MDAPAKPAPSVTPAPLRGVPLTGATGLRLVVANDPPFVLDVDTGGTRPVTGMPTDDAWVQGVGADAVAVSSKACVDCPATDDALPAGEAFVVRAGTTTATALGPAWDVAPGRDGRSVWLRAAKGQNCTLREVGLDGRERRAALPIDCRTSVVQDTPSGLLAATDATTDMEASGGTVAYELLDPATGKAIRGLPGRIHAAIGDAILGSAGPPEAGANPTQDPFFLIDRAGRRHDLGWPSELPWADEIAVLPGGRLAAVGFADPAHQVGQAEDLWLLDTATLRWRHVPDMPAEVLLKRTSMDWTRDGRLVLLGETGGLGAVVGVWRPGDARIAVRPVKLPERSGFSDSFAAW